MDAADGKNGKPAQTEASGTDDSLLRAVAHVSLPTGRARQDDPDPERIAHFRIVERLGRGGMGIVYRAEDEKLHRAVALKVLPRAFALDEERRRRFLREGRAAAAIAHPNVATIHDVGEVDGCAFLAMELIEGESLRARLARGRLPVDEALRITTAIAHGLARAHDKGVVHRDLKPDNVMIATGGEVKILDFGLAKVREQAASDRIAERAETDPQTEEGRILGTPGYMSPEQARGKKVDHRTDLFSLGVVLYEMLTGERPFRGDTPMDVAIAVSRDEPTPVGRRNPQVPPALERVVDRLLAKQPGDRHGDAQEVLDAIGALPPRSRGRAARRAGVALGLVATLAAGSLAARRLPSSGTAASVRSAPVAASSHGVAITDHPAPATSNPDAAREYALAMQALRDGSVETALRRLRSATRLDPGLAAAQLRTCLACIDQHVGQHEAKDDLRKAYAAASQARSTLGARDLALLQVAEAFALPEAPDFEDIARRARTAADAYPGDAETRMWAAVALLASGRRDDGLAQLDRAAALDSEFAWPFAMRAIVLDDEDGALAAANRCVAIASSASTCVLRRLDLENRRGDCEAVESDARRLVAIDPNDPGGYRILSQALLARDAPVESFHAAQRSAIERIADPYFRKYQQLHDEVWPVVWFADFIARADARNP